MTSTEEEELVGWAWISSWFPDWFGAHCSPAVSKFNDQIEPVLNKFGGSERVLFVFCASVAILVLFLVYPILFLFALLVLFLAFVIDQECSQ